MYSTIAASGGSTEPNTLVTVDRAGGTQQAAGTTGATPEQFSLTWDATSGFLFGVNPYTNWGVITKIDPATGQATTAATLPQRLQAIAVSPTGQMYAVLSPRTLVLVDLSKPAVAVVGEVGSTEVVSIDFGADGKLYGILHQTGAADWWLVTIDPATGSVTSSVNASTYALGDIAVTADGSIYATNWSWTLVRIDPTIGYEGLVGFGKIGALQGLAISR